MQLYLHIYTTSIELFRKFEAVDIISLYPPLSHLIYPHPTSPNIIITAPHIDPTHLADHKEHHFSLL